MPGLTAPVPATLNQNSRFRASPNRSSQAASGVAGSQAEWHRQKRLSIWSRRSGLRESSDPQTTVLLTDRAARSCSRQISEAAQKGRPPDPGLPKKVAFRSNGLRRRGSEVREQPSKQASPPLGEALPK